MTMKQKLAIHDQIVNENERKLIEWKRLMEHLRISSVMAAE